MNTPENPKVGDLCVWVVVNPPGDPTFYPVASPAEGERVTTAIADQHLLCDCVFANAFGIVEWDGEEWTEWYEEED